MALPPLPDWVEMQALPGVTHEVAPDGCHYPLNAETGRLWVRPYHVSAFVQRPRDPLRVVHPDVANVTADAIGNGHWDIHDRIAAAAQALSDQQADADAQRQAALTPSRATSAPVAAPAGSADSSGS